MAAEDPRRAQAIRARVADPGDYYTLYVEDNEEGANAVADQIVMNADVENTEEQTGPTCETDIGPSDAQPALAHGNVQFHKGKASRKRSRTAADPKVVSLAGLR